MNQDELNALPEKVIGCAYNMGNKLGCGFWKKFIFAFIRVHLRLIISYV